MTETIATAFWRRLDVPGRDAARVTETANGYELFGQATFLDPRGPTTLRYVLDLAPDWSTREGRITGFIGERSIDTHIALTPEGWTMDGKTLGMPEVVDLDLGFTPATNMIQLRRVNLGQGQAADFDVAWLDTGDEELVRLPQYYERIGANDYDYHSPTVDYRATIVLAASGFAAVYPGLWEIET